MATWESELPPAAPQVGDTGHTDAHGKLVAALTEVRTNVDAAEKTATWGQVANRPATYPPTEVPADTASGLAGGTVNDMILALAARVQALEEAAAGA